MRTGQKKIRNKRRLGEISSSSKANPNHSKVGRKRRNIFLDDEAADDDDSQSNDEESEIDVHDSFIDDTDIHDDSQNIQAAKRKEIEMNKIALLVYLENMNSSDLEDLGLTFNLSQINEILFNWRDFCHIYTRFLSKEQARH